MSQQGIGFELLMGGSAHQISVAVVNGVEIFTDYEQKLLKSPGDFSSCVAAIRALADNRQSLIANRYRRLVGAIWQLTPICSHRILLCPHEPSTEIALVHIFPCPQDSNVPRAALGVAEGRGKLFLREILL